MTIFIKTHFYKLRRTQRRVVVAVVVAVAAVGVPAVAAVAVVTAAAPRERCGGDATGREGKRHRA